MHELPARGVDADRGTDLKCYCRVMYRLSWSKGDQTEILACDGPMIGQEAQE